MFTENQHMELWKDTVFSMFLTLNRNTHIYFFASNHSDICIHDVIHKVFFSHWTIIKHAWHHRVYWHARAHTHNESRNTCKNAQSMRKALCAQERQHKMHDVLYAFPMMEANIRTNLLIPTCFPPKSMLGSSGLDLGKSFNCAFTVQQSWWSWMKTCGGNTLSWEGQKFPSLHLCWINPSAGNCPFQIWLSQKVWDYPHRECSSFYITEGTR